MRLPSPRGLALLATVVALSACSPPEGPIEWHVSEYRGRQRSWQAESTFEKQPPKPLRMQIYEVTRYPDMTPTKEQRAAAQDLVLRSGLAAERNGWFEFQNAVDDGYELIFGDKTHYAKKEYFADDRLVDPDRPEVLMYYNTKKGKKLAGYMFYVLSRDERGPQIGGPLTVWHYHKWWEGPFCMLGGMLPIGNPDAKGVCRRGTVHVTSPEMIHVWLIEHPEGRFATNMSLNHKLFVQLVKERDLERADGEGTPAL